MKIPKKGPNISQILQNLGKNPMKFIELINETGPVDDKNRYLHWDQFRFKPLPPKSDYTHEELWMGMKLARRKLQRETGFVDKNDSAFCFSLTDSILKDLHWLDQQMAGNLTAPSLDNRYSIILSNEDTKKKYILRSLIEESISSSQLEGATTTRSVAQEMLRKKRQPRDGSEQMIYNNYQAMEFIKNIRDEDLTESIVFEIHKIITKDTLANPESAGAFRTEKDQTVVEDTYGEVLHYPPKATDLPKRLQRLVAFANYDGEKVFIHPIIRAIILHFMIGYDHPFVDGNGRTARALFYWCLIRRGYWMGEYISISEYLKKAPVQYGLAYLHTENDDNDMTYFIIHQLDIVKQASEELIKYIGKKDEENKRFLSLFPILQKKLNNRQFELIKYALKNPQEIFTMKKHQAYHQIVYQTARTDLLEISGKFNLLEMKKNGKSFHFTVPIDMQSRIKKLTEVL